MKIKLQANATGSSHPFTGMIDMQGCTCSSQHTPPDFPAEGDG